MPKTTSDKGIKLIAQREGVILRGYKDSKNLLTIGVGHLVLPGEPYKLGQSITREECDRLLKQDLKSAEKAVNDAVRVSITQNQFDAMVSLAFNIGNKGFKTSQVVRKLNALDYDGAANAFMNWCKPVELTNRRKAEKLQFLSSDTSGQLAADIQEPNTLDGDPPQEPNTNPQEPNTDPAPPQEPNTLVGQSSDFSGQPAPAVVEKQRRSVGSVIYAGFTLLLGYITLLKIDVGEILTPRIQSLSNETFFFGILGISVIALGVWLWDRSGQRPHEANLALIASAADQNKNTVVMK